jgi:hypothetical protein
VYVTLTKIQKKKDEISKFRKKFFLKKKSLERKKAKKKRKEKKSRKKMVFKINL